MSYYCLFQAHLCTRIRAQSCHHASQALQTSRQGRVQPPSSEDALSRGHRHGKPQRGHGRWLPSCPLLPGVLWSVVPQAWEWQPLPCLGNGSDTVSWVPAQPGLGSRWVRGSPELGAGLGVSSPAKRSLSSMRTPQTQLTFSTVCFYTEILSSSVKPFAFWSRHTG